MKDREILKLVVKALDDKKAEEIQGIKVTNLTIIADYFVIATGNSNTQIRALAEEVEFKLKEAGIQVKEVHGDHKSGWIILDYYNIVVHIFQRDTREFYALDRLWDDGEHMDIAELISE